MLDRFPDWPDRLTALLAERRTRAFRYGEHDCVIFAGDAVHAITGVDVIAKFRGKYKTARGAASVLGRYALDGELVSAMDRIANEYGIVSIGPSFAQRGDVGIGPAISGPAAGQPSLWVNIGAAWAGPAETGIATTHGIVRAWVIGRAV